MGETTRGLLSGAWFAVWYEGQRACPVTGGYGGGGVCTASREYVGTSSSEAVVLTVFVRMNLGLKDEMGEEVAWMIPPRRAGDGGGVARRRLRHFDLRPNQMRQEMVVRRRTAREEPLGGARRWSVHETLVESEERWHITHQCQGPLHQYQSPTTPSGHRMTTHQRKGAFW